MNQAGTHTRVDDVHRSQGHLLLFCTVAFVTVKLHTSRYKLY